MQTNRLRQPRGFALILTLMLLVVAGTALGVVTRLSLARAADASYAQEELQLRWGTISLQNLLLSEPEKILQKAEESSETPLTFVRDTLELGGIPFTWTVADEQAKVNLNAILARQDLTQATAVAGRLAVAVGQPISAEPRPLRPSSTAPTEASSSPPRQDASESFGSFEQVYPLATPDELFGLELGPDHGVTASLTLWGDGKVNVHRADAQTMAEACQPTLSAGILGELVSLRTRRPGITVTEAIAQIELKDDQRKAAAELLTDRSTCYSVLLTAQGRHRSWHRLVVVEGRQKQSRTSCLEWNS
ncbi:MAG: general secretion pathway protein GspK [Phycisphaeraceae bacterium]|nr:general secretion pathway protein GspK [Phycisphaeraceae bacterium]